MPLPPRPTVPQLRLPARVLFATSTAAAVAAALAVPASAATAGPAWNHADAERAAVGTASSGGPLATRAAAAEPTTVVAVRGTTGHMYVKRSTWGHFVGYGGQIISAPAVVSAHGVVYYVAQAADGTLAVRTDHHGWSSLSGAQCSEPAAAVNTTVTPTRFIVACRGTDNALYYGRTSLPADGSNPQIAGPLVRQGGHLTAGPAVFYAPNRFGTGLEAGFLTVGASYRLDGRTYNVHGRAISDPVGFFYQAGENCSAQPTAALRVGATYLRTYFGCQTPGSHSLYYETGNAQATLYNYGGAVVGHPGIAVAPDLKSAVFFTQGADGHVYRRVVRRDGSSTQPVSLGGKVFGGVGATTLTAR